MSNGAAAIALIQPAPEHLSKDAPEAVDKPTAVSIDLGVTIAAAAYVVSVAITNRTCGATASGSPTGFTARHTTVQVIRRTGVLDPAAKDENATRIAKVATFWLDHAGDDISFTRMARAAGKRELRRYVAVDFLKHRTQADADRAIDAAIDNVFEITKFVVEGERAYRAARLN